MMNAATISAAVATILAAIQLVPQVIRLRRSGNVAGISPTWVLLGASINSGWVMYRWSQQLWLGIPSPAIAAALYIVTLVMISRLHPRMRGAKFAVVALVGSLCGAAAAGGWLAVGIVLALSSGAQAAPSLWVAFRTHNPIGVAPQVWMIGLTQAVLWGHYGWWHGDAALMVYATTTAVASTAMLARFAHVSHRLASAGAGT
jgi:uncharacterized protein with PQ loop repeat